MKYEGYKIGPVIRDIRKDKGLLIEEVAAKTGISVSTLGQVEQGGRNLSMKNLYMLIRNLSIAPSKGSLQIIMQLRKSLQRSNTVKLFCYLISRRITCGTLFAQGFAKTKQT